MTEKYISHSYSEIEENIISKTKPLSPIERIEKYSVYKESVAKAIHNRSIEQFDRSRQYIVTERVGS